MSNIEREVVYEQAATKLAAAILLSKGEISLADIQAMPFVVDEQMALNIVERLLHSFETATTTRINPNSKLPIYENVIVLGRRNP